MSNKSHLITSWKHKSKRTDDPILADKVWRTIAGNDGKIKDQFQDQLRELKINPEDLHER